MLWAGTELHQLYLAQGRCGVLDRTGTCHWYEGSDLQALLDQGLSAVARRRTHVFQRRPAMQVWLSGALIRPFMVGPVAGLKEQREAVSLAQAQAGNATGLLRPCEVRLEGSVERDAALATAIPAETRLQIERAIRRAGFGLKALRPWWAGVLEHALTQHSPLDLLAVEDTESLVVLTASGDTWISADSHTPTPGAEETQRMIKRLSMGSGIQPNRVAQFGLSTGLGATVGLWPAAKLLTDAGMRHETR